MDSVIVPTGVSPASSPRREHTSAVLTMSLACAGVLYLVTLGFGLLRPLALWKHPEFIDTKIEQLAVVLGVGVGGLAHGAGTFLVLSIAYALALVSLGRSSSRLRRILACFFPVAFVLVLIGTAPLGSKDIYHYVAEGRILVHYNENPLVTPPNAHPDDPLLSMTKPWDSVASRYGPVWALLTFLPARIAGDGYIANLLAFKVLVAAFYLASIPLFYLIAERVKGGSGAFAVVLFAWHPLVTFDILVNAHNDMPMLTVALASILLALNGRWRLVFPVLTISVLIKFVTILLGPLLLVWMLSQPRQGKWRAAAVGLCISALLIVGLYAPFWQGTQTFDAVRRGSDWVTNSPTALLVDTLSLVFDRSSVVRTVQPVLLLIFVGCYLLTMNSLRRDATPKGLLTAGFNGFFLYLFFVAGWFWPWYVLWPLAMAAALKGRREAAVAVIFATSALLGHIIYDWKELVGLRFEQHFGLSVWMSFGVFLAPVMYWLVSRRLRLFRRRLNAGAGGNTAWTDNALQP